MGTITTSTAKDTTWQKLTVWFFFFNYFFFFKITLLIIFCSLGVIGIYFPPSSSLLIQNSRCSSSYFLPPVTPYISTCIILQHLHLPAWRLCEKMFLQALIYFFLYRFLSFCLSLLSISLPAVFLSFIPLSCLYLHSISPSDGLLCNSQVMGWPVERP